METMGVVVLLWSQVQVADKALYWLTCILYPVY